MTVFLHGFWGQPSDWNEVLTRLPLTEGAWIPDLYEPGPLDPSHDLEKWTTHFLVAIQDQVGCNSKVQLVGYSMGGRLALNALMRAPHLFSRALILSSTPFLSPEAHKERASWEESWKERFLSLDWQELESAWQDQSVFSGSKMLARRKEPHLPEMLGLSLANWSVRHHPFGEKEVRGLGSSVDWAFGALDQKYRECAKTLQELPVKGQITVIPQAGHRVISDASLWIADWVVGKRS